MAKELNFPMILGVVLLGLGVAESGTIRWNKMEEELKRLSSEYADLFAFPTEDRVTELEFKIADLDWKGIYLAAPDTVSGSIPGIPVLALMKRSALDEWMVRIRKNSFLVITNLESETIGITQLHKPPIKRLKPLPDTRGRKPDSGEGFSAGAIRRVIGDSPSDPLASGEYAISLISYGRISNQCRVHKEGIPESRGHDTEVETWPWDHWGDTKSFRKNSSVLSISQGNGLVLAVGKQSGAILISGGIATKARRKNLISPGTGRKTNPGIQGGIHVDLVVTSLDRYPPEIFRIAVPVLGTSPLQVGDSMSGWFSVPFPFQASAEDRMLYAFAEGNVAGPVRIPGTKQ